MKNYLKKIMKENFPNLPKKIDFRKSRKLTELVEFGHKIDEKMKAMLRETKENVQGTNSDCLLYTSDAADEVCRV